MIELQWMLVTVVILVMAWTLTKGQSSDTQGLYKSEVWCPQHTKKIMINRTQYRQCEPQSCVRFNEHAEVIEVQDENVICPVKNPKEIFLSPSCQWVRLRKDDHFQLDLNNGSIYEMKTNWTHHLGSYIYNPDSKEAIVCREQLLADDDTEDITLWCSSHTIDTNGPPKIQTNGSLYVPQLEATLRKGLYRVHNDSQDTYRVDVCLKMDLEFIRCDLSSDIHYIDQPFRLRDDLSFMVIWGVGHKVFPVGHYYSSVDLKTLIVCAKDIVRPTGFIGNLYILFIVSAVFLLLTLLAHLFYPELNYHTKALVCHVFTMMVMYICLAFKHLHLKVESMAVRLSFFYVFYVSIMSTFLWMSVIAYGIWRAFANLRVPCGAMGSQTTNRRRFAVKCLFAWGIPVVLCVLAIGLSLDHNAAQYLGIDFVSEKATFFDASGNMIMFVYGPMAFVLVVNLGFFGLTIWNIRTATQNTAIVNDKDINKLFYLSMKLFVVTGIIWMTEVILYTTRISYVSVEVYYFSCVINGLQGVAIFVVYVCKRSTWRMIKSRCQSSDTKSIDVRRSRLTLTHIDTRSLNRKLH